MMGGMKDDGSSSGSSFKWHTGMRRVAVHKVGRAPSKRWVGSER